MYHSTWNDSVRIVPPSAGSISYRHRVYNPRRHVEGKHLMAEKGVAGWLIGGRFTKLVKC